MVTIAATSCMLIGCRSGSPPNVAESKGKPTPVPVSQTDSVSELVDMFLTNRDWTESLPMAEQEEWERTHPGWSPPVIDHDDQTQAAFQLTQLGPKAKAAAPAMIKSLASTNRLTRHWAIQVLQAIGSASPEVVPALVHELDNRNTANEAADALIIISLTDTNVLARVMERLESDIDLPEAKSSARVLHAIGVEARPAVPLLIRALDNTNAFVEAILALSVIGPDAAPAVPHLLRLYEQWRGEELKYPERHMIVGALGSIGPAARAAVPMLKGLKDYEASSVPHALLRIEPQNPQLAIETARRDLEPKETHFWQPGSIELLGEVGPPAQSVIPILLRAVDSPAEDGIAFNAAWAIWRIDPSQKAKVAAVFERLRSHEGRYPYEDLPMYAAGALWQIEPERKEELRPAVIALLNKWKNVPAARMGGTEMIPLLPALKDIADNPQYAGLRPWAILAMRNINAALSVR